MVIEGINISLLLSIIKPVSNEFRMVLVETKQHLLKI
jgi:hypothetical protein